MKTKLCLVLIAILLIACFKKKHTISSFTLQGNTPSINNKIELCLEKPIGYSTYALQFKITLKSGENILARCQLIGSSNPEQKCFTIYLGRFTSKMTTDQYDELIEQIYEGNISGMVVTIFDQWEKDQISSKRFINL